MKHEINNSYPDETHITIAVMCEEEEKKVIAFLERQGSLNVTKTLGNLEGICDWCGEELDDKHDEDMCKYLNR